MKDVYIVDDEDAAFLSIKMILERVGGIKSHHFKNAMDALRKIDRYRPDLMFVDVLMPDCTGLEMLDALRKKNLDIPVVMISADKTAKTAVECIKKGALDYVVKPFRAKEVIEKTEHYMKK